ncbi:MAG: hydroxyacylglutathione hydrolase [Nevskiales bacterium]
MQHGVCPEAIPALHDNYIWALRGRGEEARRFAVVDPGEAAAVRAWLRAQQAELAAVLITHHHWDHTGGIAELLREHAVPVYGPAQERAPIPGLSHPLQGGEQFTIDALGLSFDVVHVPGHTLGAIAFYGHGWLFSGDTLFSAGCGRLFEGTPAMMHSSLSRLAALPPATQIFCGHEYTLANLQFARVVEPDNVAVAQKLAAVRRLRDRGQPSLPSTLADEQACNPFLRCAHADVQAAVSEQLGRTVSDEIETFAGLRRWKDQFKAPAV